MIIGAVNSSATFEFARALRAHQLGTLVGQTTGGNQRGINGGAFFFLRLPNSGIELDLPLIGQFPAGDPPDAGLEPDIAVQTTIDAIAAGRDAELGAVMEAISRQPKA
jgi:C-terminal processing protease CtpA/Prc